MLRKLKLRLLHFVSSKKQYPIVSALAAGLYPLLYYYNANFTFVNSWKHLVFFIGNFIVIPSVVFVGLNSITKRVQFLKPINKYVLTVLNFVFFAFLIIICTSGFGDYILVYTLPILCLVAILLHKYLKKIIVLQLLMALLISAKLIPNLYRYISYSNAWLKQPDNIKQVTFKERPNVYIIQPDGYANFSQLKKAPYNFDNSNFETFLHTNQFKLYQNFRSNYYSTLSSNTSMFAMKHHYFNKEKYFFGELNKSREIIAGNNPVVSIFNANNYNTSLVLEMPYLIANKPELGYDYCNINYNDVSYLARGFEFENNIHKELKALIKNNITTNNFYFIEKMAPGHISSNKTNSKGKKIERERYLEALNKTNNWLKETINIITVRDENALIVLIADHGGFVGLDYTSLSYEKQTDKKLITSIFTSALAIRWPNNNAPKFDNKFKTNVNLFRLLFSYLSKNEDYLNYLQNDGSYLIIKKGAPPGIYEVLDKNNNAVFNRVSK